MRATRVPPVAALRADVGPPATGTPWRRLAPGSALLAAGGTAVAVGLAPPVALPLVAVGAGLALAAVAVLGALLARPVTGALGLPVAAARGVPGGLARLNTLRNPRRTTATAAALTIGLGLVTFALVLSASLRGSVRAVVADNYRADYQLAPADGQALPAAAADAAAAVGGVATADRVRSATVGVQGDARLAVALDPSALDRVLAPEVVDGDLARLVEGVSLDRLVAQDLGVGVGDRVDVALGGPDRAEALRVVAVHDQATLLTGGEVLVSADRLSSAPLSSALLRLESGADPGAVRAALDTALAPYPAVRLLDVEQVRARADEQVDRLLGLVVALLLLSVVIALVGIANTLGLSVLERTRELGLLRAVGMSRRQIRTMVRWEAVLVAVFGAGMGLVVGLAGGWLATRALRDRGLDVFAVPVPAVTAAVALAGLAGVLAAAVPAWRAARVDPLTALRVD